MNNYVKNDIKITNEIPTWLESFEQEDFSKCDVESHEGIKYLRIEEQYYLEKYQITRFYKIIKQVVSMQGVEACSKILIDFNPNDQITINEIFVYREGQKIDKSDTLETHILRREYQAEQNMLSGILTLSLVLSNIKVYDIITFSYSIISQNEFYVKFFDKIITLEYTVPVQRLFLAIIYEKQELIHYKFLDQIYKIENKVKDDKNIFIISKNKLPAKKILQYEPCYFFKSRLQIGKIKTWQDLAVYYQKYFEPTEIKNAILLKFIDDIKKENIDDENIIIQILSFIHNEIRYFSNSNPSDYINPTNPNITTDRRYGDCKDFVVLALTILKSFNIESYAVLVSSSIGKYINYLLPSTLTFDHVILQVNIKKGKYFIDLTFRQVIDSLKHNYLFDFGYGLVCANDTENLIQIVNQEGCTDKVNVREEYEPLNWQSNKFIFKTHIILTGLPALKFKAQHSDHGSLENLWSSFQKFYLETMEIREVIENRINDIAFKNNQISYYMHYEISLKNLFKNKFSYFIKLIPRSILEYMFVVFPSELENNAEFYYGPPITVEHEICLKSPDFLLVNTNYADIKSENFVFSQRELTANEIITIQCRFKRIKDIVSNDYYSVFLSKIAEVKSLLIIIVRKKNKYEAFCEKLQEKLSFIGSYWYIFPLLIITNIFLKLNSHPKPMAQSVETVQLQSSIPAWGADKNPDTDFEKYKASNHGQVLNP